MRRNTRALLVSVLGICLLLVPAALALAGGKAEPPAQMQAETKAETKIEPKAEAPSGPVRGGKLTMAVTGKMSSLDPVRGNAFLWEGNVILAIYERLYRVGDDGNYVPELATSWRVSEDKKQITLQLRKGVSFHDGTPFNAAAAKVNLDRLMDPKDATQVHTWFKDMKAVTVVDEYTVRIEMARPSAMIMDVLTSKAGFMVSPAALKQYGDDLTKHPTGTGPFKLVEWVPGDHVLMKRNESYWDMGADGKPLPYFEELLVRIVADDSVRLVELQTGNIDIMQAVPAESLDIVRKDAALNLVRAPSATVYRVYVNFRRAPTDNLLVRQAINYAFDRQAMAEALVPGQGFKAPFYYLPNQAEYDDYTPYSYDPEKAKKLLAQAGYPNGLDLGILLISREPDRTVAPVVQAYLQQIGVRAEIQELERLAAIEKANAGDFDLYLAMAGLPQPSTQILIENMWTTKGPWNRQGYSNAAIDALAQKLGETFEPQERIKLLREAQRLLLEDGETALFGRAVFQANTKRLHDYTFEAEGALRFTRAWIQAK